MKTPAFIKQVTEHFGQDHIAAARRGNVQAQFKVGMALKTVGEDDAAFPWFEKAALKGHAQALNNYAIAFLYGHGTDQDIRRAVRTYLESGEKGYATAYDNLAAHYENGFGYPEEGGIKVDIKLAIHYAEMAAQKGDAEALFHLCKIYDSCEDFDHEALKDGYIAGAFKLFQQALKQKPEQTFQNAAYRFLTRRTTMQYGVGMTLGFPDGATAHVIPSSKTGMVEAFKIYQQALTKAPTPTEGDEAAWAEHMPSFEVSAADNDFRLSFVDGTSARVRLVTQVAAGNGRVAAKR